MSEAPSLLKSALRAAFTLAAVAASAALVAALWHAYVLAPWTRDGRVGAHVVRIAPEVSGTVVEVAVTDNQRVNRGDVLYRIDPQRFRFAVAAAQAQLAAATQTWQQKSEDARRRRGLDDLVSGEEIQRARRAVAIADAERQRAQTALDAAQLDLERSVLRAPADGYVTRLRLRRGDYASAGHTDVTLLDAHGFWITGYFEETKLHAIRSGAPAQVHLMGYDAPIRGHVGSIGRGIADANEQADELGLPNVNPSFSWVRLAQRVPVRIELDHVPDGIVLVAGMTGSIDVGEDNGVAGGRLLALLRRWM